MCRVVLAVWRGCANIFWGVEDSSAWWVTNRSRIGEKSRQAKRVRCWEFLFLAIPFFSPAWSVLLRNVWLGTKSVQVTKYSASKKGYLLVRRACFSPKPGSGNKGEGGIRCLELGKRRIEGVWARE